MTFEDAIKSLKNDRPGSLMEKTINEFILSVIESAKTLNGNH